MLQNRADPLDCSLPPPYPPADCYSPSLPETLQPACSEELLGNLTVRVSLQRLVYLLRILANVIVTSKVRMVLAENGFELLDVYLAIPTGRSGVVAEELNHVVVRPVQTSISS
jgi:hypothetical protein